jgi:hypothetical protein
MISPSAWTATGPTQWFEDYKIISVMKNPLARRLSIINMADYLPNVDQLPKTTKEMMASPFLKDVKRQNGLENYVYVFNRASRDTELNGLGNDFSLVSQFENKVWLREQYGDTLHFPEYIINTLGQLQEKDFGSICNVLHAKELVVQHPSLAGARGTYFVSDQADLERVVISLKSILGDEDKIVIAKKLINIQERTLQVCITTDRILVGPAQAQLIGHPFLVSSRPGDIQFCGGRITSGLLSDEHYKVAFDAVQTVGARMQKEGYRGIFGMDLLVSEGQVYTLEVNPRMTGLTTLLAFLQQSVPFLLLHILELASSYYTVTDNQAEEKLDGSVIQVYAQQDLVVAGETGLYDSEGLRLGDGFTNGNILPDNDQFFVAMRVEKGQAVKQGKSLAFIYSRTQLFDDNGNLDPRLPALIKMIRGE